MIEHRVELVNRCCDGGRSSPVPPAPAVRFKLTDYQVVTHEETGITLEYWEWSNPDTDEVCRTIESNYGFGLGDIAALRRTIAPYSFTGYSAGVFDPQV